MGGLQNILQVLEIVGLMSNVFPLDRKLAFGVWLAAMRIYGLLAELM